MAANMNLFLKEVQDITECPICTDMFCIPKMLPCLHTFCLKCIEQYGEDKRPGEALPCPMCQREFNVPTGGLSKLSCNFFIDQLISAHSRAKKVNCDVCTKVGKEGKVVASSFCMTCRENLCDECCKIHKSMKVSMGHKLSPVGEVSEAIKKKLEASFCEKHPTKELEFYCQVCNVPCCATCSITNHKSHETCEIGDIAETFKKNILKYSDNVSKIMRNIEKRSGKANERVESFTQTIERMKSGIIEQGDDIKRMVDRQTNELLEDLNFHKTSVLDKIEIDKDELRRNMMICDNFKQLCTKVVMEVEPVEVVRAADELRTRAEEVKCMLPLPKLKTLPQINFMPFDLDIATEHQNIVGRFSLQNENDAYQFSDLVNPRLQIQNDNDAYQFSDLVNPRLQRKLPTSGSIHGITSLNDELYVVTRQSPDIDVYDIDTLDHRRKIKVEGLVDGWDMVAHANVLYVSEYEAKRIHKIQLSDETSSHWSVNSDSLAMSINKKGNIVVSCWDLNKITEYTPTGSCVREIQVNAIDITIGGLQHAIQLDDDRFLICHTTTTHDRVCIIDSNGRVMKSYGGGAGSGIGQMDYPCYLAIDQDGYILVADLGNNRIIQLNASLEFIGEFIPGSAGLKEPGRMHLHEDMRLLYVADEGNFAIFHW